MARRLKTSATYDDLAAVSENLVAEIFDGELYASPRPALPHSHAASALGMELGPPFQRGRNGPGGWWLLDEPELHFGQDVLVPDLAGWRRERLPAVPRDAYLTLPPDWICEVLSPSTAATDRTEKLPLYARSGVPYVWLIDPLAFSIEVYQLDPAGYLLVLAARGEKILRVPPFDAIELDLTLLWGDRFVPGPQREEE